MDVAAERIAELEAVNSAQASRIVELEALVAVLVEKITVLERLVKGDSSNSSRPPSSDPATAKNKRPIANGPKLNRGAKRSQGKQPGTPGRTLAAVCDPDEVITHAPATCRGCGSGLGDAEVTGVSTRQVFDIPARTWS